MSHVFYNFLFLFPFPENLLCLLGVPFLGSQSILHSQPHIVTEKNLISGVCFFDVAFVILSLADVS